MICSLFVDKVNKETYLCAMKQEYISRIRSFNRYYTKILGILNKYYLGSELGLPEVRIIQDVYLHPDRSSKDISNELNMDKGLLSLIKTIGTERVYISKKHGKG